MSQPPGPLRVGQSATISKVVSPEVVKQFADLVGDRNPVHLDPEHAARSRFGRPIAHGMLAASLISAALGTELPGPGTIYLSQTLQFRKPVFVGDEVTATVTIVAMREDRPILTLETVCSNQAGEVVVTGEATVLFEAPES